MKFELTISQQDELTELKRNYPRCSWRTGKTVDLFVAQAGNAVRLPARSILSAREWEVLHLIVEGFSTTEIARHRNSVSTIATQKHNDES